MSSASLPQAFYLEAIKLNKENNTSLMATLVNYFPGISGMFCGIFFPFFFPGSLAPSLFSE